MRESICTLNESISCCSHCADSMELPPRIKTELPNDPASPLWSLCPKERKTGTWRGICIPPPCSLKHSLPGSRCGNSSESVNGWMEKMCCKSTMECYSARRKREVRMDLEGIVLSEINQAERNGCYMISLKCIIWKSRTHRNGGWNASAWGMGEMGRCW